MHRHIIHLLSVVSLFLLGNLSMAADRVEGTIIKEYGAFYAVKNHEPIPEGTVFKIAYDVNQTPGAGQLNLRFNTLARFLNMHADAGVPLENMHLAITVHGPAAIELLKNSAYKKETGVDNANAPLIEALIANGVQVILCGQSATGRGVDTTQLIDGVKLHLSAMSAHAMLQQSGYTLNPF